MAMASARVTAQVSEGQGWLEANVMLCLSPAVFISLLFRSRRARAHLRSEVSVASYCSVVAIAASERELAGCGHQALAGLS